MYGSEEAKKKADYLTLIIALFRILNPVPRSTVEGIRGFLPPEHSRGKSKGWRGSQTADGVWLQKGRQIE